jgi:hypothetical protein
MPTAYFNITNPYVMRLVDEQNFKLLDEYLSDDFDVVGKLDELNLYPRSTYGCLLGPWIGPSDQYNEKLYDILSYAIPKRNLEVVKKYGDKINIKESFDGNAYRIVDLLNDLDPHSKPDIDILKFYKR